jgi:hypothetical protein
MEMKKFDLFLFLKSIEDLNEEHISSLQSFESSLLLAMHDRWIASVISITNGIETLLRVPYGRTDDLSRMINLAVEDGLISKSLGDRGHEIRKLRNSFIHNMVSPRDNPAAAYAYIIKAIPLYRSLVKNLLNGTDVFDIIENEKIKLIYDLTRSAIMKLNPEKDDELIQLHSLTVFKKTIVNTTLKSIAPLWVVDRIGEWQEDHKNNRVPTGQGSLVDRYQELISPDQVSLHEVPWAVYCPAVPCTGYLVLEVSHSAELIASPLDIVEKARCPLCDLLIEDKIQLQAFVEPQLPSDWIVDEIEVARGKEVNSNKFVLHGIASFRFRLELRPPLKGQVPVDLPGFLAALELMENNVVKTNKGWFEI